jgi:hypothetical protein
MRPVSRLALLADVDECATVNGGCNANATCLNAVGGRTCTCNTAFTGNGITCAPVVIELTIAASTTAYDVFLQAGAPVIPRVVRVTINAGVTVSSTSTVTPAFIFGGAAPGLGGARREQRHHRGRRGRRRRGGGDGDQRAGR